MKNVLLAAAIVLFCASAFGQTARTFDIEAYSFGFRITPPEFFVNQGDSVTLRVKGSGHGFALERYGQSQVLSDVPVTLTFVADKSGTFSYGCTIFFCGFGHYEMYGEFEVIGPDTKPFAITTFEPANGKSAGGDIVMITGTGFTRDSTVYFGTVAARFSYFANETTLFAETPPHPAGTVPIVVRLLSGRPTTSTSAFTYTRIVKRRAVR